MHDRSLFDPANNTGANGVRTKASDSTLAAQQVVKSQETQMIKKLPGVDDSFDSQGGVSATGAQAPITTSNPYSILKSSALWKKK